MQNNNFARASRCLRVRFFALVAQLESESPYLHFLWMTWSQDNDPLVLFLNFDTVLRIQLSKKSPTFDEMIEVESAGRSLK